MSANIEPAQEIKRICDAHGLLLATAESVAAGRLQSMIAAVSGASTFFQGGITAYNIDQKVRLLGVERAHAELVNCVSERVAAEMAEAATRLFQADIGLATTGYAEPPHPAEPLVSYAFYAIWEKGNMADGNNPVRAGKITSSGRPRMETQRFFADYVLQELVGYLRFRKG
jgi:nicotinamide-nucleotide amidase